MCPLVPLVGCVYLAYRICLFLLINGLGIAFLSIESHPSFVGQIFLIVPNLIEVDVSLGQI